MLDYKPTEEEQKEFANLYAEAMIREGEGEPRMVDGQRVIWSPQDGPQTEFMQCPLVEAVFHGTRGNGKTDTLLMTYGQHVGQGWGVEWRGIIFRQTYPQLADIQAKSEKWFRRIWPSARFNRAKMMWEFPDGETLFFRHMAKPDDYWNYHGHAYPFIGWEELCNWKNDECYKAMMSCLRSTAQGIPKIIRGTTNPYGVGHNWMKRRFRLAGQWWKPIITIGERDHQGNLEHDRIAIYGHVRQNKILMEADPEYERTLAASASNPAMLEAWKDGSWDIVAGGMFDDVWNPAYNVVQRFNIPLTWKMNRSFDWGSSKPFSVSWWAESDGSDVQLADGSWRSTVRGDLFRIKEWYGWTGQDNTGLQMLASDVAKGIVERELKWGLHGYVGIGPADSSIFNVENGKCIATDMQKRVRIDGKMYNGISWTPSDKRPGSRKNGWEMMRTMIKQAHPNDDGVPREEPGLFIFDGENEQFLRTVISLPRDSKDMDDVDTDAEDHIGDDVRYRIRDIGLEILGGKTKGHF